MSLGSALVLFFVSNTLPPLSPLRSFQSLPKPPSSHLLHWPQQAGFGEATPHYHADVEGLDQVLRHDTWTADDDLIHVPFAQPFKIRKQIENV